MCNRSNLVFFGTMKGKVKIDADVIISNASAHGSPAIRISIANDSIKKLGDNVERIIVGIDPTYRNRLYFFDSDKLGLPGYKLINCSKTTTDGRKYIRVDSRSQPGYNILGTVGKYHLERDVNNDLFIALSKSI